MIWGDGEALVTSVLGREGPCSICLLYHPVHPRAGFKSGMVSYG